MADAEIRRRLEELRRQIHHHNRLYYVENQPILSDREFDRLLDELIHLESENPDLYDPSSPTQRVGGKPLEGFESIRHAVPMLSLNNTYNEGDLIEFDVRVRRFLGQQEPGPYAIELKIDGIGIALHYDKGRFQTGVTRGDGTQGDNVTENLRTIRSLPLVLSQSRSGHSAIPPQLEVRGEVFFRRSAFETLNAERLQRQEKPFANPRNACAGTLKLLDPSLAARRPMDLIVYTFVGAGNHGFASHIESLLWLKSIGFPVNPLLERAASIQEVIRLWRDWDVQRQKLDYETDGLVVKIDHLDIQQSLGFTAKSPRWAIAAKFDTSEAITRIKDIVLQVGRTGTVTPVADLEPVALLGTTIHRASLHNADEIQRLDVRVGDTVAVEKGGEIIPKVTRVLIDRRSGLEKPYTFPRNCPICKELLSREEGEVAVRCTNDFCPAQRKRRILHFASRAAMDIEGCGTAVVDQLVDAGLVNDASDLYILDPADLMSLPGFAEKSALNLVEAIRKSRRPDLHRFLFALGIRHVGAGAAKILAAKYKSLKMIQKAGLEDLEDLENIGKVMASSIHDYFNNDRSLAYLKRLNERGVKPKIV
ncbi:MAG: NAD-dependent DNA ligase LigA, partial [Candidatus Eisenbacteria bacterium]|nr:NAD-dependent DNA ligase LigA [Candidatus Eisenbacteria bacterium]